VLRILKRCLLVLMTSARHLYWQLFAPIVVGVRAIILCEGKVLLVRHSYYDRRSWYLPGGGVRRKEALTDALRREIKEELNADIRIERLHGIYYNFAHGASDHVAVFIASLTDQTGLRPSWEISEFGFFDPRALPDPTSPASRRRIEEYLASASNLEYRAW
jgi:ADP-ribose pyrophosphatase YjhB (NUDIX family)